MNIAPHDPVNTVTVHRLEELSPFPTKTRECVAFALLCFATLCGKPSNVPNATGANCFKRLGCPALS